MEISSVTAWHVIAIAMYETQLMDEYYPGVSDSLFVFL